MRLQQKSFRGTDVREFYPLPTFSAEAYPPYAESSIVVDVAAGVVRSCASSFCAAGHQSSTNPIQAHPT